MNQWKENWAQSRERMMGWWNHANLVIQMDTPFIRQPLHETIPEPVPAVSAEQYYCDADWRIPANHYRLAKNPYGFETLPIADIMIGPGSLALYLGSEPGLTIETVWFNPVFKDHPAPEELPVLRFQQNHWWQVTEKLCRASVRQAQGKYLIGIPDLVENIDVLASLRDAQTLMVDMIERPGWVAEKVMEINRAWFEAYDRIYELIQDEEGGSCWGAFGIWSTGKTAKLQCDACAMFSPRMFRQFVTPALTEQCAWLDTSMYHLDGPECICHLDNLLAIDELDAIEWTPGAAHPGGADPRWHEMYRHILNAGKSLQVVGVEPEEVVPFLDLFGGAGIHILTYSRSMAQYEQLQKAVEPYYTD
ncbi:MAG: hypothetical protein HPY85_11180 [Anaerolineae bacterium]|nr:hypothetical protein [Anaerolineae bacterium]